MALRKSFSFSIINIIFFLKIQKYLLKINIIICKIRHIANSKKLSISNKCGHRLVLRRMTFQGASQTKRLIEL